MLKKLLDRIVELSKEANTPEGLLKLQTLVEFANTVVEQKPEIPPIRPYKPRPEVSIWTPEYKSAYRRARYRKWRAANPGKRKIKADRKPEDGPLTQIKGNIKWKNTYRQIGDDWELTVAKGDESHKCLIDNATYEKINLWNWRYKHYSIIRSTHGGELCLRTVVAGEPKAGEHIQHLNKDTTDYRACNLKIVNSTQHKRGCIAAMVLKEKLDVRKRGMQKRPNGTGSVTFHKLMKQWSAILPDNEKYHGHLLGWYPTEAEAEAVLDRVLSGDEEYCKVMQQEGQLADMVRNAKDGVVKDQQQSN